MKNEGTKMAVCQSVLVDFEEFDSAHHFYLDETDSNMRLVAANHLTAIAPLARMHHEIAQSIRRHHDRGPRDLFNISASWAVFQRKFIEEEAGKDYWNSSVQVERKRLIWHIVSGGIGALLYPSAFREADRTL